MLLSFFRILFSAFITWSFCAAAVIIPVLLAMRRGMFRMPLTLIMDDLLDLMKTIDDILAILVGILAVLMVPVQRWMWRNPRLRRPGLAWMAGVAVSPLAAAIWLFGLDAIGLLRFEELTLPDWFILAGASAVGGVVFAFMNSYLATLQEKKNSAQHPVID